MYKNGEDNAYKFIEKENCAIVFYNSPFHSFVTKCSSAFFFPPNFLSGAKYLRLSYSSSFENKFGF